MLYFLVVRRNSPLPKLFLLTFFGVGLVFILLPEISNQIAWSVGIGRGVDLILYLSTLALFVIALVFYIRFRDLEAQMAIRPLRVRI